MNTAVAGKAGEVEELDILLQAARSGEDLSSRISWQPIAVVGGRDWSSLCPVLQPQPPPLALAGRARFLAPCWDWRDVSCSRLLHPQHFDGIWIRQDQYRMPLAPLSEYSEPWF